MINANWMKNLAVVAVVLSDHENIIGYVTHGFNNRLES